MCMYEYILYVVVKMEKTIEQTSNSRRMVLPTQQIVLTRTLYNTINDFQSTLFLKKKKTTPFSDHQNIVKVCYVCQITLSPQVKYMTLTFHKCILLFFK